MPRLIRFGLVKSTTSLIMSYSSCQIDSHIVLFGFVLEVSQHVIDHHPCVPRSGLRYDYPTGEFGPQIIIISPNPHQTPISPPTQRILYTAPVSSPGGDVYTRHVEIAPNATVSE